jgi:hypothetical protein
MSKLFLTRQELSIELGIDPKTLRRVLCRNQIDLPKGLIIPAKAEEIRIKLGVGNCFKKNIALHNE